MKKGNKFLILLLSVSFLAITHARAQDTVVVSKIPIAPKYKHFARPTKYHVWHPDEWLPYKKTYVFRQGYWDIPPTPNSVWKKGSWRKTGKGYVRVNGYWEQVKPIKR